MADLLIPLLLVFFLVGAVLFGLLVHFLRGVEDPSVWTPPEHGPLEGRSLPWDRLRRERSAGDGGDGRRTLPWQQGQSPARGRQAPPAPAQRRVPQSRPAAPPPQRPAPSPQRPAASSPEGAPAARSEGEGVTLRRPAPAWLEQRQREAAPPAAEEPPAPRREPQSQPAPPRREPPPPAPPQREPQARPASPAPARRDRAPSRREPAPATRMERGRKGAYAGLARLAGRPGRKAAGARPTFPWQQPKDESPASAPARPSPPRRESPERPAPLWSRGREEAPRASPEPARATPAQPREGRRCSTCGGSGTAVVRGPSGNLGRGPCPDCQ